MFNKITNRFNIRLIIAISIFLTCLPSSLFAQNDLKVIKNYSVYRHLVQTDSLKKMIELKTILPGIQYDLRYATSDNFMHKQLYKNGSSTFLRLPAARALVKVQQELDKKDLSLKIWDAYRPYSITVMMWNMIKDERYVADPKKGSGHNRGLAVDLTIIDKTTGVELNMGTGFDSFSDTAHQDFRNLSPDILRNRDLLRTSMEKYGFKALETEWWHFYMDIPGYELLDIPFEKFKKNFN